jgi:hypothetical protein
MYLGLLSKFWCIDGGTIKDLMIFVRYEQIISDHGLMTTQGGPWIQMVVACGQMKAYFYLEKSLLNSPTYQGWSTSPLKLWNGLIYPWTFQNRLFYPLGGFQRRFYYSNRGLLQWRRICYNACGFVFVFFYSFPLNLWKIIVNHRKIIKWQIQFC